VEVFVDGFVEVLTADIVDVACRFGDRRHAAGWPAHGAVGTVLGSRLARRA
jgi:hypothetical protein